jgi:hypothetical protein
LFGSKFYIRGAYTDAVKSYAGLSERSADTRSIRVDSYLLLDNMQRYISLGLRADEEDALDNSLDYTSRAAMLAYAHRFDFFRTHLDMKTRLGYEGRKYRSVSEDTIGARIDKRVKAGFYADLALGSYFGLRCRVEYSDVRSNADSINADKWIYGIGLTAEF